MERKNVFQLINENYSIVDEVYKIFTLFNTEKYFSAPMGYNEYTFKTVIDALFCHWEHCGTCLNVDEFLQRANATIDRKVKPTEQQITNYLEALENFLSLHKNKGYKLSVSIQERQRFNVFLNLIESLEKKMGLIKNTINDTILLYHENGPLEQVINITTDEDVQWELIRYVRENMSLGEKRKSLAYLATNLNIEQDSNEKDPIISQIMYKATNVLNNLQIRHNNTTGKWENSVLDDITDDEAIALCDLVFNQMLTIVLLRQQKNYENTYTSFNNKQKQAKNKKK